MTVHVKVGDVYTLREGLWWTAVWKVAWGAITKKCYKESWFISRGDMFIVGEVCRFGTHVACFVMCPAGNGWVCFTDPEIFLKLAP